MNSIFSRILATFYKQDNLWIFGSQSGQSYNDNSKYLFEYVSRQQNERAVWLSRNRGLIKDLRNRGKKAYHFYSAKGIYYALTAKYIVMSYSYDDVSYFAYLFPWKSKIINLYHATPLKKLDEVNKTIRMKFGRKFIWSYLGRKYDLITSASPAASKALNDFFKIDRTKYVVSGYPRNDALFDGRPNPLLEKLKRKSKASKTILFAPTYREYAADDKNFNLFEKYGFDQAKLTKMLQKEKAVFLIKLHYNDYAKSKHLFEDFKSSDFIHLISNEDIQNDIYPLLGHVDMLITDYSSICFDYLLLNRPLIFSSFDIKMYQKYDRGFSFDYQDVTPGPKAKDWLELIGQIEKNLNTPKLYEKQRLSVNRLLNQYHDKNNSQRAYEAIKACSS